MFFLFSISLCADLGWGGYWASVALPRALGAHFAPGSQYFYLTGALAAFLALGGCAFRIGPDRYCVRLSRFERLTSCPGSQDIHLSSILCIFAI